MTNSEATSNPINIKCFKLYAGAYGFKNNLIVVEVAKYLNVDKNNRFEGWYGNIVRRSDGELIYRTVDANTKKEAIRQMQYFVDNPIDWGFDYAFNKLS